jgi:hypothetical protein
MKFVALEAPIPRITFAREFLKFLYSILRTDHSLSFLKVQIPRPPSPRFTPLRAARNDN